MPATVATPKTTMDLLDLAIQKEPNVRELARKLSMKPNNLHVARNREHLSPNQAAAVATFLGLDPVTWMAIALVEQRSSTAQREPLLQRLATSVQNS